MLNVALNTLVFLLSYIAGVLATKGIRNLLLLRLHKNGTAPIFCESESRLQRFIDFMSSFRYCQSPTKFLIILLSSVLFLLFEISAESGVDSSNFCRPNRLRTKGLCARPYDGDGSAAKIIASALYAQRLKWNEKDIVRTPIPEGFRNEFDGREAFDPATANRSLRIVVANCSVEGPDVLPPRSARITFQNTRDMWHLRMTAVQIIKTSEILKGSGDVTSNPTYYDAFLVAKSKGGLGSPVSAYYFEYPSSRHVKEVHNAIYSSGDDFMPLTVNNKAILLRYTLHCGKNALSGMNFGRAVQIYRSTQVESSIHLHPTTKMLIGKRNISIPKPISAVDVVKATIAMKATDRSQCIGETHVYTTCGVYDVIFLLPVIVTLLILLVIVLISTIMIHSRGANIPIPTTAIAWSKYAWREICKDSAKLKRTGDDDNSDEDIGADIGTAPIAEYYIKPGTRVLTLRRRD